MAGVKAVSVEQGGGAVERSRMIIGWCLLPGLILFAGRLVYEKTLLTWSAGPQMVGFALQHRYPTLFLLGIASYLLAHLWVTWTLGMWLWKGGSTGSASTRPLMLVVLLTLGLSYIPAGTLRWVTVKCLGPGPQAGSLLIQAAAQGDLAMMRTLLAEGVAPNSPSPLGDKPLLGAARGGSLDAVKLLLDAGADINVVGQFGETAVRGAAENGHLAVVRLLIERGADLRVKGPGGFAALEVARANGHGEVAKALEAAGRSGEVKGAR